MAFMALGARLLAQPAPQKAFDVASVKANKTPNPQQNTNVPLGPGAAFTPTGGYFSATGVPLAAYIAFAYKMQSNEVVSLRAQLPEWAISDPYDIQAKVEGNPGKDEMRLLMQNLLAERFKLAMHKENREVSGAVMVVAKPGKLGPQIQPHPADSPCPLNAPPGQVSDDPRFPLLCGGLLQMQPSIPGRTRYGGRNVTIDFIAKVMSAGSTSGRPLVDGTGLSGNFDFNLEWTQQAPQDDPGLSFDTALREQLGFKLEARKVQLPVMVLDHVERPSEN
jgi:uncharacterized protein (TIGR03435 family)